MNEKLRFDENNLIERLDALSVSHRTVFAASCSERLLPNYQFFSSLARWGDYDFLRLTLDKIWLAPLSSDINVRFDSVMKEKLNFLAPDTEDYDSFWASLALDAVSCVFHAIECCQESDPKIAAVTGRIAYSSIYSYYLSVNDPNLNTSHSDEVLEEEALNSSLMQQELQKQASDLDVLQRISSIGIDSINQIRLTATNLGVNPSRRGFVVR